MAQGFQRVVLFLGIAVGVISAAGGVMAAECSLISVSNCSNEEICFALLVDRMGSAAEKETLKTGIPANFLFEIDEAFGKSFAHSLSVGASHSAAYRTAEGTLKEGEGSSFNQEAASMQIDAQSMKKAVDIFYGEFANDTEQSHQFIQEARLRSLICPPMTKKRN